MSPEEFDRSIVDCPVITEQDLEPLVDLVDAVQIACADTGSSIVLDTTSDWKNYIEPYRPICETFICPNCGAAYLADSAGFIPNCNNCGSVMKREVS